MTSLTIMVIFLTVYWTPGEWGKWCAKARRAYDKEMNK